MGPRSVKNNKRISEKIKNRRIELSLTIEEAAIIAHVGTKTWSRYEAGGAIRKDKVKGICKALNWPSLQENTDDGEDTFTIEEIRERDIWPVFIEERFGKLAAASFVIGSDILLDNVKEELESLSKLPKGSHIGQLDFSMLRYDLPEQFLTRYDYEFMYDLMVAVRRIRSDAQKNSAIVAHRIIDELVLYLILEESRFLMDGILEQDEDDYWEEWVFELLGDSDIFLFLYGDLFSLTEDMEYHFKHWLKERI